MRRTSVLLAAVVWLICASCASNAATSAGPSSQQPSTPGQTTAPPTSPPATSPSPTGGNPAPPPGPSVKVTEVNFAFTPVHIVIGQNQGLTIKNNGTFTHNFSVKGTQVNLDVSPGQVTNTEAIGQALTLGDHPFFCKYHKASGMIGVITVVPGP